MVTYLSIGRPWLKVGINRKNGEVKIELNQLRQDRHIADDPWLFVSDVDDTLSGNEAALVRLAAVLRRNREHLIPVYNSSRPCASVRRTLRELPHLPMPDLLIGALGTEIEEGDSGRHLSDYQAEINRDWQREQIAAMMNGLGFRPHDAEFQTPFKASYDVPGFTAYQQVLAELEAASLKAKVIFSAGKNLDLIPPRAGKGTAIEYLRQLFNIPAQRVVVAGDSENDLDMFSPNYKGIVVANATARLRQLVGDNVYQAHTAHAAGVLEGLRFWQVIKE